MTDVYMSAVNKQVSYQLIFSIGHYATEELVAEIKFWKENCQVTQYNSYLDVYEGASRFKFEKCFQSYALCIYVDQKIILNMC